MSLNIIDNFRYLGRKFLDSRQSFDTLEQMKNCNDVPNGFVTYCNEDKKRYTYDASNEPTETLGKWKIYTVSGGDGGSNNVAMQPEEPDDEDAIWFDTDGPNTITNSDSAIINEMKEIIQALTAEVRSLKARVEYLELNGGGGTGNPDTPVEPDVPESEFDILLEDGTPLLLEDGTPLQLEEQAIVSDEEAILLEDKENLLLEDNTNFLLE